MVVWKRKWIKIQTTKHIELQNLPNMFRTESAYELDKEKVKIDSQTLSSKRCMPIEKGSNNAHVVVQTETSLKSSRNFPKSIQGCLERRSFKFTSKHTKECNHEEDRFLWLQVRAWLHPPEIHIKHVWYKL